MRGFREMQGASGTVVKCQQHLGAPKHIKQYGAAMI